MNRALEVPMKTVCLDIQSPEAIPLALRLFREGELVVLPTDTVYGLGAHGFLAKAVARLYQVKERPGHVPIPLLIEDAEAMSEICAGIPPLAWRLAERFWPGGLTMVMKRTPLVPDAVTAGGDTVAVRVPDQPLVRLLCRELGAPLAVTSANLHGKPDPVNANDAEVMLRDRVPLILDGGQSPGGMASTVLNLTVSPPAILRTGLVTAMQLAEIGPIQSD
jgi:L-threonylcarbamoyladenylate synthase